MTDTGKFCSLHSATSVIVIMGFLAVILILSGIGIGCSYLCYRRSERKALSTTRKSFLCRFTV